MSAIVPVTEALAPEAPAQEAPDAARVWRQYICRACGLIYDEAEGDLDSGLAPGTRFEDIPDDWECPICGVTKADFEPYVKRAAAAPAITGVAPARKLGIVIVGAGTAGWSVAEAVRALDADVSITIVTGCEGDVYHKPELSVALARGQTPERLRRSSGRESAARLGVRLLGSTVAVRISASARRLRTTRGPIGYSHLVLAQGAHPAPSPALPPELCWRINDLGSWSGLHGALQGSRKRVAVVGAGMVGCELAEDLARSGHTVTLVGRRSAPLAGLFPERAAARVQSGLEGLGVAFLASTTAQRVVALPCGSKRLETVGGRTLDVDVVISAIGLTTRDRLAATASLAFENGLVVDPRTLRTSAAGIYAIGDCISIEGRPCRYIEPIGRQAETIAHEVLGREHGGYEHAHPVIRLKTKSAPLAMHGCPRAEGVWRVTKEERDFFEMEQWHDGALIARLSA